MTPSTIRTTSRNKPMVPAAMAPARSGLSLLLLLAEVGLLGDGEGEGPGPTTMEKVVRTDELAAEMKVGKLAAWGAIMRVRLCASTAARQQERTSLCTVIVR
jgi:hypothetical protein